MTITLSSILLTEYVFLSFPRLKKEQVLLALFKVKKTWFLCIVSLSVLS